MAITSPSVCQKLPRRRRLTLPYTTTLTPDTVRGDGRNSAILTAIRNDNGTPVRDGPSIHQILIRSGITADTGTIIGGYFVDKNFDGEQQPNEPGIPNAVIFLDDGNRVTYRCKRAFSVRWRNFWLSHWGLF